MERIAPGAAEARIIGIESLEQEARGVGRWQGKTIFVEGALPGERVEFSPYRRKPAYEFARLSRILHESPQRVVPRCPHFGVCGGCSLQHFEARAQVAAKQRILEDALWHIGRVKPEHVLPAIYGPAWEYRQRARLAVRNVPKKGGVLVGFHERSSSYVADMTSCQVLPERISSLLPRLRELVSGLSVRDRLPQIEVACGENVDVLVLRILQPLNAADEQRLRGFSDANHVVLYLQPGGPESAEPFHPVPAPELAYNLPAFGLSMRFGPTEFTQVNAAVNRVLVSRAVGLLRAQAGERVADMFCGLGNFSLAIARGGANVVGFEGTATLIARATRNAEANDLAGLCRFVRADLYRQAEAALAADGPFDRMLVDPPRDGAIELIKALREPLPKRIVYVSCNPATLARDSGVLVQVLGYRLEAAGVVNMFPHTAHVESIAVFQR
ncbi:MAG: 23S rRNA (uracil(1939)-C(5))-methyltransferase RlmD [Betaproteobacteria bacterium]|nr:MAG: 23S rRNA (uracil(1939)-C(5))-methyltransferase RlmD [Betaproteobacteria bacterium]